MNTYFIANVTLVVDGKEITETVHGESYQECPVKNEAITNVRKRDGVSADSLISVKKVNVESMNLAEFESRTGGSPRWLGPFGEKS